MKIVNREKARDVKGLVEGVSQFKKERERGGKCHEDLGSGRSRSAALRKKSWLKFVLDPTPLTASLSGVSMLGRIGGCRN